jgi:hypothetical protein
VLLKIGLRKQDRFEVEVCPIQKSFSTLSNCPIITAEQGDQMSFRKKAQNVAQATF